MAQECHKAGRVINGVENDEQRERDDNRGVEAAWHGTFLFVPGGLSMKLQEMAS
jgi:hypothetical protein